MASKRNLISTWSSPNQPRWTSRWRHRSKRLPRMVTRTDAWTATATNTELFTLSRMPTFRQATQFLCTLRGRKSSSAFRRDCLQIMVCLSSHCLLSVRALVSHLELRNMRHAKCVTQHKSRFSLSQKMGKGRRHIFPVQIESIFRSLLFGKVLVLSPQHMFLLLAVQLKRVSHAHAHTHESLVGGDWWRVSRNISVKQMEISGVLVSYGVCWCAGVIQGVTTTVLYDKIDEISIRGVNLPD